MFQFRGITMLKNSLKFSFYKIFKVVLIVNKQLKFFENVNKKADNYTNIVKKQLMLLQKSKQTADYVTNNVNKQLTSF